MDEQVICIDGKFTPDQLAYWAQYGVVHPEEDKLYGVRGVVSNSEGNTGIFLDEIHNPKIPIQHPILGKTMIEPYWHIRRFAHLDGTLLTKEEVKEWDRVHNLTKNLNF